MRTATLLVLSVPALVAAAARAGEADCPARTAHVAGVFTHVAGARGIRQKIVPPLCVDRTEVTVAAYASCVEAGRCTLAGGISPAEGSAPFLDPGRCNSGREGRGSHPVNCVDAAQAAAYCRWRGGRLPTVDEWAWAAGGSGGVRRYPWGDAKPDRTRLAACRGPRCAGTTVVGAFLAGASRDGLLDLAGNVAEWTDTRAPGDAWAVKGGSWASVDARSSEIATTTIVAASARRADLGFRCVFDPGERRAAQENTPAAPASGTASAAVAPAGADVRLLEVEQACLRRFDQMARRCEQECFRMAEGPLPDPTSGPAPECAVGCRDAGRWVQFYGRCVGAPGD